MTRTQVRDRAVRDAKLEALQAELDNAVASLVTGEDWKRALTFAAQFRSRSFNNTMLIYVQHHAAYVEGRVPEQAPDGPWDGLADQITGPGYELRLVSNAASIGGANGLTDFLGREVSVRIVVDDAAQAKTLAHELGHVLLHEPKSSSISAAVAADAALHRGVAEVEAESVALMVGAAHGLDTSADTSPYVSTWAASVPNRTPAEVVQATAERVRATAMGILDNLDPPKTCDGNPPGLDRDALVHGSPSARPVRRDAAVLGL